MHVPSPQSAASPDAVVDALSDRFWEISPLVGYAHTARAILELPADLSILTCRTTIAGVVVKVVASARAIRLTCRAVDTDASSLVAVRRCPATHIAAGPAVVGIPQHRSACPGTFDGALDAVVHARSVNARTNLIGTNLVTSVAAGTTVVEVVGEVGAGVASASTTETSGVAVARSAGGEALVLPRLVGTATAKCLAGVLLGGPRGAQSEGTENSAR